MTNVGTTSVKNNTWDAFKAFIRGCYQFSISQARKNAAITIEEAETRAQTLEFQFVLTRNPVMYLDMQAAYREVMLLRVAKAKKIPAGAFCSVFSSRGRN